jgi:hypothetical protein
MMGEDVPLAIRQILVLAAFLLPALAAGSPGLAQSAPPASPGAGPKANAPAAVPFEEVSRRAVAARDGGDTT